MRISIMTLLIWLCMPVHAEVYKCVGKNGTVAYQPNPCSSAIKQEQIQIISNPAKEEEARAKLEAVRSEYESRKTAQQEAEKAASELRLKQASVEAAQRSALAQQQQADAQRRQADAMERQDDHPYLMVPPPIMPNYGTGFNPGLNN